MTDKNYDLQNYVKLNDIVLNTMGILKEVNPTIIYAKGIERSYNNLRNDNIKGLYAFRTLIATGYKIIRSENETASITANFDYTGNNKYVILDFNTDLFFDLIKTNQTRGSKQESLI